MKTDFLTSHYDTGQSYRAMAFIARVSTLGMIVLGMLCIALVCLLIQLFPLKENRPYLLVLKDKGEQVAQIEPIAQGTKGLNLLIEGLCRRYVSLRESIDGLSEEERWKEICFLSSEDVWQDFDNTMNIKKNQNSPLKKHREDKVTRGISIKVSSKIAEGVWQVEWESFSSRKQEELERHSWVSTLQVELRPGTVTIEDQFINPIGFTVVGYTVSKREG
jgi:type IV secretion system protein VirB8